MPGIICFDTTKDFLFFDVEDVCTVCTGDTAAGTDCCMDSVLLFLAAALSVALFVVLAAFFPFASFFLLLFLSLQSLFDFAMAFLLSKNADSSSLIPFGTIPFGIFLLNVGPLGASSYHHMNS